MGIYSVVKGDADLLYIKDQKEVLEGAPLVILKGPVAPVPLQETVAAMHVIDIREDLVKEKIIGHKQ